MTQHFDPGDRLGRYELTHVIGGGGFASVWRARTVGPGGFERDVAIKVMRPGRAHQKRFQDMLLDEARLVARINHPNVAQIWEVGEDPRSLYIVLELVDGDSLDDLRFRAEEMGKSLPIRAVFRVLADVCAGLHVAHELSQDGEPLGLVHRDVSPQNILVSRHGIAKLIDFGIAKAKERLAADTTTGYIKGKISFMAPEQARTEDMDRRADVWAIGAVAYELIEGKPPCDGHSDLGRLAALVGPTPVPPMTSRVPEPLRNVVARALEKDRDARYPTALALKEAIEEALIESEMETSATEVAELVRPYFHRRRETDTPADAPGHSVERAVSSTIQAKRDTGTIELPLERRRYLPVVLAGLAVALPVGLWMATRTPSNADLKDGSSPTTSSPSSVEDLAPPREASSAPPPALSVWPSGTATAATSPQASVSPPAPSAAPSVQRPRAPARAPARPTSAPVVDENAIE
ncbi:MAG: serine/threonine protein kinase [Polyangiaceae bacterium]|nr:serine/threonine protein kinase [Polyangiaceae bacterium]